MDTITEFAYRGRDNSIDIKLLEDGAPQDITGLTRATLNLQDIDSPGDALVLVDSNLHPGIFDWTTRGLEGILQLNGGTLATTIDTEKDYDARLTIYDLDWAPTPHGSVIDSFSSRTRPSKGDNHDNSGYS